MVNGSLWPIWFRFVKHSFIYIHKRVLTPTAKTPTIQKSNDSGAELQAMSRPTETTVVNETPDTSSSQITAFVQHGVVTIDCQ